jgi:hypothetical protein
MPLTYSSNLRLTLIGNGEQSGTWGDLTNINLGTLLEQAISGYSTVSITDADFTLTTNNGAVDQARSMALNITSSVTLTATRNVICPSVSKLYVVRNATTGGQSIVIKTSAGSGITVANGATAIVLCDGTDVIDPFSGKQTALGYTPVNKAGDTMTGQLTLPGSGSGSQAATVSQITAAQAGAVAKTGDTMTGQLNITATNNTPYDTNNVSIAVRNTSTTNATYAALALNNAAANLSALLFTEYAGTNASRFAIATNPGTSPASLVSRFAVNSDGSFSFLNNSSQLIAVLDASGNLSVKGNVTAFAPI